MHIWTLPPLSPKAATPWLPLTTPEAQMSTYQWCNLPIHTELKLGEACSGLRRKLRIGRTWSGSEGKVSAWVHPHNPESSSPCGEEYSQGGSERSILKPDIQGLACPGLRGAPPPLSLTGISGALTCGNHHARLKNMTSCVRRYSLHDKWLVQLNGCIKK